LPFSPPKLKKKKEKKRLWQILMYNRLAYTWSS